MSVRTEREGGVAWVRVSREPDDLLDPVTLGQLRRALVSLTSDPSVRVLVFSGEPGRFPRQMDPDEAWAMAQLAPPIPAGWASASVGIARTLLRAAPVLHRLLDRMEPRRAAYLDWLVCADALERSDCVTIAAIDGDAFGGGMELALCCDLRVCSDRAQLAQPEVLAGVMAGFGATERLPRIVGSAKALELLLLCEALDADQAAAAGLVNRVLPSESFEVHVNALAKRLAARPAVAVAATKRAVRTGDEVREMLAVWHSAEARSGLERVARMVRSELERDSPRSLPDLLRAMEA